MSQRMQDLWQTILKTLRDYRPTAEQLCDLGYLLGVLFFAGGLAMFSWGICFMFLGTVCILLTYAVRSQLGKPPDEAD